MAATMALEERQRPHRGFRHFLTGQTKTSTVILLIGSGALALLFFGSIVVLTVYGWTPVPSLTEGLESRALVIVVLLSMVMGVAGGISSVAWYRSMPSKPSREATVAGGVFGIQAIVLAGVLLWFRAGDVELVARNFLNFQLIGEFFGQLLRGARNTLILSASGIGLGIVLGLILAVFAMSSRRVVRAPARIYINFFRGTPLLWQLSFMGLGVVTALRLDLSAYQVAILIIGLNSGAYSAEIFRAGIQSLERGQMEAARSVGMSYLQSLRYVILPQAIRRVIPPLTNEFVILIKDTSLVSVLGLTFAQRELLSVGRGVYSITFDATAWLGAAAGYLAITIPLIRLVTILEKRLRSGLTSVVG